MKLRKVAGYLRRRPTSASRRDTEPKARVSPAGARREDVRVKVSAGYPGLVHAVAGVPADDAGASRPKRKTGACADGRHDHCDGTWTHYVRGIDPEVGPCVCSCHESSPARELHIPYCPSRPPRNFHKWDGEGYCEFCGDVMQEPAPDVSPDADTLLQHTIEAGEVAAINFSGGKDDSPADWVTHIFEGAGIPELLGELADFRANAGVSSASPDDGGSVPVSYESFAQALHLLMHRAATYRMRYKDGGAATFNEGELLDDALKRAHDTLFPLLTQTSDDNPRADA